MPMHLDSLTRAERQLRMNIRNFLLVATEDELKKEYRLSWDRNDMFRCRVIQELIYERQQDED